MNDLSAFREAAAAMRSREGFGGAFINFNGETSQWTTGGGDRKTIIDEDRRFVAGVSLMLHGWQRFQDNKPVYADVGFVRDRHKPRPRAELGDLNKTHWRNGVDPWQLTFFLPMLDPETRQSFMFTTNSGGGKDALADLQAAFVDHNEQRPDQPVQWPLVELASDHYVNTFGKKIFKPIFDIVDWVDPPVNFQAVTPPPDTAQLRLVHKATGTDDAVADDERTMLDAKAERPNGQDSNDEAPF